MRTTGKVLASSSTKRELQKLAREYFLSDVVLAEGGAVLNSSQTGSYSGFSWIERKGRFQLMKSI